MRNNLIKLRKKRDLTQTELAEKIPLSIRQYKALEAATSKGSVDVWERLKEILKAPTIDYLLQVAKNPVGKQANLKNQG